MVQMEHETALSDLDATRKRAQLLENEKEYLRVELMRQQKEAQRAFEQVSMHGVIRHTHRHTQYDGNISHPPTHLMSES
jgi:hypothetical protein